MKQTFFHRYLSAKVLPIWTILLIDVFIIVISCILAYALRYDFRSIFLEPSTIDKTVLWTVVVNLIFFRVFRTYSNVLRFSSFVDILRIFVALTVSYALLMIMSVLTASYLEFRLAPISVLFMSYIINFAMMACSRVVVKTVFAELRRYSQCQRVYLRCQGSRGQHCQGIARQSAQPLSPARIHCGRT